MATNAQQLIELEVFSALKQSILRFIFTERQRLGLPYDHPTVVQNCIQHFDLGLVRNQCLKTLILQISASARAATQD